MRSPINLRVGLQDRRNFYWYVVVVFATAPVIGHMFYRMWISGVYSEVLIVTEVPILPEGEAGMEALVMLGAGLYTAWLMLFANDHRKRYQGLVLSLISAVVVVVLAILGIGLPNIDPTLTNLGFFIAGVIAGVLSEGLHIDQLDLQGDLRKINFSRSSVGELVTDPDGDYAEFPIASYGLLGSVVLFVLAGNILSWLYVDYQTTVDVGLSIAHLVFSLVFLRFLKEVIELDIDDKKEPENKKSFEIVGPKQSGKTYSALALYYAVDRGDYELVESRGDMDSVLEEYREQTVGLNDEAPDYLDWSIGGTLPGDSSRFAFDFITGGRFPTYVSMEMLDHPGEKFGDVASRFDDVEELRTDGGSDGDEDRIISELWDEKDVSEIENDNPTIDEGGDKSGEGDATDEKPDGPIFDEARSGSRASEDESLGEGSDWSTSGDDEKAQESSNSVASEASMADSVATTETSIADSTDSASVSEESEHDSLVATPPAEESSEELSDSKSEDDDDTEDIVSTVEENIKSSHKLVFLLDMQRFVTDEEIREGDKGMQVDEIQTIAQNVDVEEVLLVASKADYLIEHWREDRNRDRDETPHQNQDSYREFREYVTEIVRRHHPSVPGLCAAADSSSIHPVYFVTGVDDDGTRKPKPTEMGELQPVGYDRVLELVIRDW